MSQRNWRDLLKEMEMEKLQDDSLELGDSWRAMPRRTAGVTNKTNALYRRSAVPQLPEKNMYELILQKQPQSNFAGKTANTNSENETAATHSQNIMIPTLQPIAPDGTDTSEGLNFSQFLSAKSVSDGINALTSTPYPRRQIDGNKSPVRTAGNTQLRAINSPKKMFLAAPSRIPVGTPRTSRIPSLSEQRASHKQPSDTNKMSSPIVSSTVDNGSDDNEVQAKSPKRLPLSSLLNQKDRMSPTTENPDKNSEPFDEDQREVGATKVSDEELFRRPQIMVRRPSQKQLCSDTVDETMSDHSKLSTHLSGFQKAKKSIPKVNPLLESYKKVGESIINRTNSVPSDCSSSSNRRRLYRKGDSCNEDQLLQGMESVDQQFCDLIPVPSNENKTFSISKPTSLQPNADDHNVDRPDAEALQKSRSTPELERNNCVDDDAEAQDRSPLCDEAQHASSSKTNTEKDRSTPNSIDQSNHMSKGHGRKLVLKILQDWSDMSKQPPSEKEGAGGGDDDDDDDNSASSDTETQSHGNAKKQPSAVSKVRQVRSKIGKSDEAPSKTTRRGRHVRTDKIQQVEEEASTEEEDEISMNSLSQHVRPMKQSVSNKNKIKQKEVSKKSKTEPVHSTQQHKVIEEDNADSDENEQIVEQPPTRRLRTKAQEVEEKQVPPPNKSQPTKRRIDGESNGNKAKATTKSKVKPKNNRLYVEDDVQEEEDRNEVELPTKSKSKAKRLNVEEEEDRNEVELPTKSKSKAKRLNDEDEEHEVEGNSVETTTKSKSKPKTKRLNVEEEEDRNEVELPTKSKSKAKLLNDEDDEHEVETTTKSKVKPKRKRLNVEEEEERNKVELPTKTKAKAKKNRLYVEVDVQEEDSNKVELPKNSQSKKKRLNVEEDTIEVNSEPTIDIAEIPAQPQTGDNAKSIPSTTRSKAGRPRKRKHESVARSNTEASMSPNDNLSTGSNESVAKRRKKTSKWDKVQILRYDALKPRKLATGMRHSTRDRRKPHNNLFELMPTAKISSNRSALQQIDNNVQPRRTTRVRNVVQSLNVFSMLLNGTMDKEPPIITNLHGIEITQGFHITVKNNLTIHHIPGETGPSYGYFKLDPGAVKRPCRISWNLHIHVVSGPIEIITEGDSETMVTGSFASLHSGTKYSLRNDGNEAALIFFSQHWSESLTEN